MNTLNCFFSKNRTLTFIFSLTISCVGLTQPSIEWQKSLGGSSGEVATDVVLTPDGGYLAVGEARSANGDVMGNKGLSDVWLVKLNALGAFQWQKTFGGSQNEFATEVLPTTDGGYIITAYAMSSNGDVGFNHGEADYWIIKTDALANVQWKTVLGGSGEDVVRSVCQTADGGYILSGESSSSDGDMTGSHGDSDGWVIKLSANGSLEWQRALGGSERDAINTIFQMPDGSYLMAGSSASSDGDVGSNRGAEDVWVVKLSSTGELIWEKNWGGSKLDLGLTIRPTADGGYVVCGESESNDGDVGFTRGEVDTWILKFDSNDHLEWKKTYGGSISDVTGYIRQTPDGGFVAAGLTRSNDYDVSGYHGGLFDGWVIKLSSTGQLEWQKTLGGTDLDDLNAVWPTPDGGYVVAGTSDSQDGDLTSNQGGLDLWVIKLSSTLGWDDFVVPVNSLKIFPNPAQESITLNLPAETSPIQVKAYNELGQEMLRKTIIIGELLDISQLPNGSYTVVVTTVSGQIFSKKVSKKA